MKRDMFGNQVTTGDVIIYPGRKGSSLWMTVGIVREIDGNNVKVTTVNKSWRGEIYVKNTSMFITDRAVILPPSCLGSTDSRNPYIHDGEQRKALVEARTKALATRDIP